MKKNVMYFLFFLVVLLLFKVYTTLKTAGVFYTIVPTTQINETIIQSPPGIEDLTIDYETNIAYLSSTDRRNPDAYGNLYVMKLNDSVQVFKNLTKNLGLKEFRPHGISFLKSGNGKKYIFAISHQNLTNEIVKFEIINDSLVIKNRYTSKEFISPNDIVAVNENQFYVTNDHSRKNDLLRIIGDYLTFPSGNVVFYNGKNAKIVSNGIAYANGITIANNKKTLLVASTSGNKMYLFDITTKNIKLKELAEVKFMFSPDNIEIDDKDNIWVACHPKLLDFTKHARDDNQKSASAIVFCRLNIKSKNILTQQLKYINDGSTISGSSTAASFVLNDSLKILVGSVFEKKILKLNF